jgi:hypothetical protein
MRFFPATATAALACAALAACVAAPEPAPTPAPAPAPAPTPTPVPTPSPVPSYTSWMDYPATPGDWSYSGGTARFADAVSGTLFELRCNRAAGLVELIRSGTPSSVQGLVVRTETATRSIAVAPGTGLTPHGQVVATDPLLDAMAFSKGRFAIEVAGLATLARPSYPEVTRVIEDCR